MAEKKEHKIVAAETGKEGKVIHEAKPVGNASGLRAGAIVLWVVAFIFEILAVLEFNGADYAVMLPENDSPAYNGLLYVFEVVEELDSDTDTYIGVEDEEVIKAVYDLFMDEVEKEF